MTEKMTEKSELIGNEFLTIEDDILIKCDEEAEGTIKIPDSVKKIKWTAFWNSEKIKEIWLPAGIERFELNAFKNCTALEKIHYNGTKSQWKKIQPKFNRSPDVPLLEVSCTDGTGWLYYDYSDPNPDDTEPRVYEWQIHIRMTDYNHTQIQDTRLIEICKKLKERFSSCGADFSVVKNGGGIVSNFFEGGINAWEDEEGIPEYAEETENLFDGIFEDEYSYYIVALGTILKPAFWKIRAGEVEYVEYEPIYLDAYGNYCESALHDSGQIFVSNQEERSEGILALPVRKMLDPDECDDVYESAEIYRLPKYIQEYLIGRGWNGGWFSDNYSDSLMITDDIYLLDKDGNKITSLLDFDHSEPDEEDNVYYPVTPDELEDVYGRPLELTAEAKEKWRKRLGM